MIHPIAFKNITATLTKQEAKVLPKLEREIIVASRHELKNSEKALTKTPHSLALASLLLPGLGQLCAGEKESGKHFLTHHLITESVCFASEKLSHKYNNNKFVSKGLHGIHLIALVVGLKNHVESFIDAFNRKH